MDKVFITIQMEHSTMDTGLMISIMALVPRLGSTVLNMKDSIKTGPEMDAVSSSGLMAVCIRVNSDKIK
jgi:hypothetical protein